MRIKSIDILRALTMVLMIWVNDFHTLIDIPKWLQHANATEDYLGFSDIIFPLFLFIVGLSIPLAIRSRSQKEEPTWKIAKHILIRSFSLLLIGFYMVNYETAHSDSIMIGRLWWCILMAAAVALIWMNWKRSPIAQKWYLLLQACGFSILIFLAFIYHGGPDGSQWMTPQWWGILGLIGWAYLANALSFLLLRGSLMGAIITYMIFTTLCILNHSDLLPPLPSFLSYFSTLFSGTIPAFTAMGVVTTLLYERMTKRGIKWVFVCFMGLAILHLIFGILTRPHWGINKIQGTPSWLAICLAIGLFAFPILYYFVDIKSYSKWSKIIMPAGTATLTCYMLPYFLYPFKAMLDISLPDLLNTGFIGLLSSLVFAILVVMMTGWLEKKGFKLKL